MASPTHLKRFIRFVRRLRRRRTRSADSEPSPTLKTMPTRGLLQLPSEIRRHIYDAVTELAVADHLALLCTCRQIHQECSEFFFRRPLVFESQVELIAFTHDRSAVFLESITNLQLRLEEVDPAIMQPFLAQRVMGLAVDNQHHPYYQEAQRILACFQRLPSLRHLALLRPRDSARSTSSETVLRSVLSCIERSYHKLESLTLGIDTASLACLSGLRNLRYLHVSGFSPTSSEVTSRLLGEMRSLRDLVLVGPPEGLRWRQSLGFDQHIVQSITPETIRQMQPLQSLTLCELGSATDEAPAFITTGLLRALYDGHRESLQDLCFSSATAPDAQVQEFIGAFLMQTTNIRSLTFAWPHLDVEFIDCLPVTTQRLQIAVQSSLHAQAVMDRLMMIRYRLPHLQQVALQLVNPVKHMRPAEEKEEVSFAMPTQAVSAMKRVQWSVTWGVWQPVGTNL